MRRRSSIFEDVPGQKVPRNLFDLSHEVKGSYKFGMLYPILLMETLPGETWRENAAIFMRAAPMLFPVMHNVKIKTEYFFVPNRLVTDHWQEFITGGQDGEQEPVLPYVTVASMMATGSITSFQFKAGSLWDHLGLPTLEGANPAAWSTEQISALPFRAYNKIYNDWYRDPTFDPEVDLDLEVQGNVSVQVVNNFLDEGLRAVLGVRKRGWRKDMFTSALDQPQRGAEVLMPLSGTGTVQYRSQAEGLTPEASTAVGLGPTGLFVSDFGGTPSALGIANILNDEVTLDSSETSINDLRTALAIQAWQEANARGGPRYVEQIDVHFGQRVPDYRLQRAEFIGGGRQELQISEVLNQSSTSEDEVVGNMYGHGISFGKNGGFSYRCEEHGFIIGIMSIVPDSAYMQGLPRLWTRADKFDFAFPRLAHLGEQDIKSKEIFFSFDNADNTANQEVFGYIPRYSEYKFQNDRVVGDFKTTLLFQHLGRKFVTRPTLGHQFLLMDTDDSFEEPLDRIFAVQDGTDYFWGQIFHRLTAKRPLPYFGVPKLIG